MKDLLDLLAEQVGCPWISDLKKEDSLSKIAAVAAKIDDSSYSADDWDYALSYLFDQTFKFRTVKEAKAYLSGLYSRA